MKLLILRTDIKTKKKVKLVRFLFNNYSGIISWSVDIEDIDNVLRIEAADNLNESDIIDLIKTEGFYCESLTY
ncbi:MAG: hypothetical protein HRT73_06605 [Flavobacteriales bacterium]|nr:hypothetical protein [Flavobacteriales bacterium]